MSREVIDCTNCGEAAGYHYPAKTYGDPDDCYPAETTVECEDEDGRPFCSEECLEEWHAEHDEPEEDDE